MCMSNDELAEQLKGMLGQTGLQSALDDDSEPEENPLETDFFKAINAFRAARNGGDQHSIEEAEERLRQVVRGELTRESS